METVELTQEDFNNIEINKAGITAKEGLIIKKKYGDDWILLKYGKSDQDGNFEIDVKQIIIK